MGWATLNGTVIDDGGLPCDARFEIGLTPALGIATPWQGGALVTGDTFAIAVTGLAGGTRYYFRANVRNSVGTAVGTILSFQTSLNGGGIFIPPGGGIFPFPGGPPGVGSSGPLTPVVDILIPTGITAGRATLNGVVSFQGDLPGSVRFHWGADASVGMVTAWQDGFGTGATFTALILGLSSGGAYHCRAEFKNGHGPSVLSPDLTFSTLSETGGLVLAGDEILTVLGGAL